MARPELGLVFNGEKAFVSSLKSKEGVELISRLSRFSGDFANSAIKGELGTMVRLGGGREAIGAVPDRPDDTKIKLDEFAENLFKKKLIKHGLKVRLITEDGTILVGTDRLEDIEAEIAADPIDNSGEHEAGLDTPPYTAFGAFDPKTYEPLVAGINDYVRKRFLFYSEGRNRLFQYVDRTDSKGKLTGWKIEEREIKKGPIRHVEDPGFVLVTYMGSNLYSLPFINNGGKELVGKMHPKGRFHGKGGSHVPLLLVTGADAYMMVDDIRTENSPAMAIAKAQGFGIWVYDKEGNITEYKYNPEIEDSQPRLHLIIMAKNEEVRNEIAAPFFQKSAPKSI
jgi:hypothetical protein